MKLTSFASLGVGIWCLYACGGGSSAPAQAPDAPPAEATPAGPAAPTTPAPEAAPPPEAGTEAPGPEAQMPATTQSAEVGAAQGKRTTATIDVQPTSGNQAKGRLELVAEKDGVRMRGTISGLKDGSVHGFHVHEKGDCSAPDAKSAGDHFNPSHHEHGKAESGEHHLGDIDNLKADAKGTATVDVLIKGATLGDGGPNDLIGKSIILHATADDYKTQPSGNSGPRIACGVITSG